MSDIQDMGVTLMGEAYQRLEEERGSLQRRMEQWRTERKKKKVEEKQELVVHCKDVSQNDEEDGEAENLCHNTAEESSPPPEEDEEGEFRWQGRKKVDKGKDIFKETLLVRNCRALLATEPRQIVAALHCRTSELSKALASLKAKEQQPHLEEGSKGEEPRQREPEEDWVLVAEDVDLWDISDEVGAMK